MKVFVVFYQDLQGNAEVEGVFHDENDAKYFADWLQAKTENGCYDFLGSVDFNNRFKMIPQFAFVIEKEVQ